MLLSAALTGPVRSKKPVRVNSKINATGLAATPAQASAQQLSPEQTAAAPGEHESSAPPSARCSSDCAGRRLGFYGPPDWALRLWL